jgi:divalent metal cation (Fe/Co/Zn/Cd) transporter
LLVSIIIIIPSVKLARSSFYKLLDSSVEETSQFEIYKQLGRFADKYCEFKDIRTRVSGRNRFIELCLVVPGDMTVSEGYNGVRFLREGIKKNIPDSEVMVMMEPCKKDCEYIKKGKPCPYK